VKMYDVIALSKKLISYNTSGRKGNESEPATYLGNLLAKDGFKVDYNRLSDVRFTVIAEKGLCNERPPLVMTGHLDTVPLGTRKWKKDPFSGHIEDGKLYGRGSSDMKCGIAAMICAAYQAFKISSPPGGLRFIFTAAEEPGCYGARHLLNTGYDMGTAGAIIVGEPTSNIPFLGHKGALYLKVTASGKTAHSSMPHLGDNAVYKAARAITKIENFSFDVEPDDLHGIPTINVGKVNGGININSVPDFAEFTVDIRTTKKVVHQEIVDRLSRKLGKELTIEKMVDLLPVSTEETSPFVRQVFAICGISEKEPPKSLSYVTDGAILQQVYGGVPTIILGPGQAEMAHQTDEYCYTTKLTGAVEIFKNIILQYGK
jgi:succinyl-diaminopimelate desuccinylase